MTDTSIIHQPTVFAEPLGFFHSFPVTNAFLTSLAAVLIAVVLAALLRAKLSRVPKRLQALFELVLENGLALADQVTGDRKKTMRIFPLAISAFFFILINNWLGILPLGAFGVVHENIFVPFVRSGTADVNTTLALGALAVIGANIFGIITVGIWKTFNKYVNLKALSKVATHFRKDKTVVLVAPVMFFVGLLEVLGEIAKVASLSFRLFGNIFAGEVLLVSMTVLAAYLVPTPFLFLEILVGLIQALIFSVLFLVYFTIASEDHDEGQHEEKVAISN